MRDYFREFANQTEGRSDQEDTQEPGVSGLPKTVNAADWLKTEPPEPNQVLADSFDIGDKIAIIGVSKSRKTFFLLQMLISIAAGVPFLIWNIPQARRILHLQFEIRAEHYHRRVRRMCKAMGITADNLGDRFQIVNGRGLGILGKSGMETIGKLAEVVNPDIVSIDPLYKINDGVENATEGMKGTLDSFDKLAEDNTASVMYIHHDGKGTAGDRAIQDRGSGSGVLGRDEDYRITLTQHATEEDAIVVETMLRNYRPQSPFTILWEEDENTGGYRFVMRPDIMPTKKTSRTKEPPPGLDSYLPTALSILGGQEIAQSQFLGAFKIKSGLSDHKMRGFMEFATAGGSPYIVTRTDKAAKNKKWLRAGKDFNE